MKRVLRNNGGKHTNPQKTLKFLTIMKLKTGLLLLIGLFNRVWGLVREKAQTWNNVKFPLLLLLCPRYKALWFHETCSSFYLCCLGFLSSTGRLLPTPVSLTEEVQSKTPPSWNVGIRLKEKLGRKAQTTFPLSLPLPEAISKINIPQRR